MWPPFAYLCRSNARCASGEAFQASCEQQRQLAVRKRLAEFPAERVFSFVFTCLFIDIEQLEKVQRRRGCMDLDPYHIMTDYASSACPSLELRRLQLDLIYCYKIVFGLVDVIFSDFFEFSRVTNTRDHAYKLYKSHCNRSTRSRFFAERIVLVWNSLPTSVNSASLSGFKNSLLRVDLT